MHNFIKVLIDKGFKETSTNTYYINTSDIEIYCIIDYSDYDCITFRASKKIKNTIIRSQYKTLIKRFLMTDIDIQYAMLHNILDEIMYNIHEQINML